MPGEIAVLLSVGRHPISGRERMPPADASALELALRCDANPLAIHAGDPASPALRDYLGMGLEHLYVAGPIGPDADAVPAILSFLMQRKPRLVLCGMRSECGEASGMLPYLVAAGMGAPLVADVAMLESADADVRLSQARPGGRRRRLAAVLPAVLTVGRAGPKPRQSAFGKAKRGQILVVPASAPADVERLGWDRRPARLRPPKLRRGSETKADAQALTGLSPQEAAERLHDFLVEHGVIAT
jgi:electron transfer flavoprotein beta subunit